MGEETTEQPKQEAAPEGRPEGKSEDKAPAFDANAFQKQITDAVAKQLREFAVSMKPAEKPAPKKDEDEIDWDEFYTDPRKVMSTFGAQIARQITGEISNAYNTDKAQASYWSDFFEQYPKLKEHNKVVRAILSANQEDWIREGINIGESHKRIADTMGKLSKGLVDKEEKEAEEEFVLDGVKLLKSSFAQPEEKTRTISDIVRERRKRLKIG